MKRILYVLACITLLMAAGLRITACADTGPKPVLEIRVLNAPAERYYLDLLIQDPGSYNNLEYGASAPYDPSLLAGLHTWEDEGWPPAFAGGTSAPLFGDLVGQRDGEVMIHSFTYHGLPQTFRIAVSCADGTVQATTQPFSRQAFYTTLTYDYASNTILRSTSIPVSYAVQFCSTFLPTLVIEGILLLLFGFHLRKNWKFFLLLNLATQLFLTATLGTALITAGPTLVYYVYLPVELVILLTECLACRRFLRGGTKRRRVVYAVCANAASFVFGLLTAQPLFSFLSAFSL